MSGAVFMHRFLGCLKLLVLLESKPVLAIFISFVASLSKSRESKLLLAPCVKQRILGGKLESSSKEK